MPCLPQGMSYNLWHLMTRERCCIFRLLVQVFGLSGMGGKRHHEVPPQFMTDLYNNIADESGVTRRRNPYNAKVVRSFIERGKHSICTFWCRDETLNSYIPPHTHTHTHTHTHSSRSQWPRGLKRGSAAARLLGLWVRIAPGTWMFVCCECCVVTLKSLRRADYPSRGVLPTVVRRSV